MSDLRILEDCRELVHHINVLCKVNFEYKYTINQQIIRSSVSIGSNIAEGNQRTGKDRIRFFNIALGSLEECRFQLSLYNMSDLDYDIFNDLLDKIKATVINLKKSFNR